MINFKVITKKNHKQQTKEEKNLLNQEMYSSVYRFIQKFYPSEKLKIAYSGNIEEAYFRFGRLDDEYSGGKKTRSDILRLIRIFLKQISISASKVQHFDEVSVSPRQKAKGGLMDPGFIDLP